MFVALPSLLVLLLHLFPLMFIVFMVQFGIISKLLSYCQGKSTTQTMSQIPPGSLGLPLIGETLEFLKANNNTNGLYDFVRTRRLRYGNCFKTSIFGRTHVFVSTTESARTVLRSDFVKFNKRYIRSMAELVGEQSILLCSSHGQHKLIRSHLTSLVSASSMSLFVKHFDESMVKALNKWEQGGTIVVLENALKITFDAMCKMLVSLENQEELEPLRKDVAQVCEAMLAVPLKLPWTRFYKGLKARRRIMNALSTIIAKRRQVLKEEHHKDLLQSLLMAEDDSRSSSDISLLTDTQIQDNILTLIIAGQDTTASAMAWMVKYLDENQEVQHKLREEQMGIAHRVPPGSSLRVEDLNQMSYASKVVKETLRMASIVPWLPRVALRDCEIEGFKIKKGWIVNVDARSIHFDPTVHHDPFTFHPSRSDVFVSHDEWSKAYSFLGFGTGGRTCLGINLAKAMLVVFLHRLMTTYRWNVVDPDTDLKEHTLFSRLKSGCPIHVTRCCSREESDDERSL